MGYNKKGITIRMKIEWVILNLAEENGAIQQKVKGRKKHGTLKTRRWWHKFY